MDERFFHRRFFPLLAAVIISGFLLSLPSAASALPERFFGMTAHESMFNSDPDWDALQKAGVQKFRMQINWKTVDDAGGWKNEWAWQNTYDQYFEKAAKRGISILPYLYARKDGNQAYFLKGGANYPEWLQFVWTVVQRYGDAGTFWKKNLGVLAQYPVHQWEVWNEPNLPPNCPSGLCNGKEYGEFLVGTSQTINEAQKAIYADTAEVLFGGIYQERWDPKMTNCTTDWCIDDYMKNAAKASGINSAYDGLSIHPYSIGIEGGPSRSYPDRAAGVPSNISAAYLAQVGAGLGAKPLWVTEVGWPVEGSGSQSVNEGEQAGLVNETYNWLKANWLTYNVKYAAWYLYRDTNEPTWDYHAGLRKADGTYRPSWFEYQAQAGAPRWPHAWYSENLGGPVVGDPEICSWGASHIEIFARRTDNALWHRFWNGSAWSGWESLGGTLASSPGCVSWGANRLDVVARSSNGTVVQWWWNGSSWQSINQGGSILGDPDIASWGPNRLDIFGRAPDGSFSHKWWDGSSWKGWESLGGANAIVSGVGAVGSGGNRIDVVGRAADSSVLHLYYWGGWHTENFGGIAQGDPDMSSWGAGVYDVWMRGSDNGLWHKWWMGSSWSPWENSITGPLYSSPGADSFQSMRHDIVTLDANGSVRHWWWW